MKSPQKRSNAAQVTAAVAGKDLQKELNRSKERKPKTTRELTTEEKAAFIKMKKGKTTKVASSKSQAAPSSSNNKPGLSLRRVQHLCPSHQEISIPRLCLFVYYHRQ